MISATANHAIRAVLLLGREYAHRLVPADEIAVAIGAPANYLSKTLHALAKAGIATSTAGRNGGFALAVSPERLTLDRVIAVFDQADTSPRCMLGDRACNRGAPCVAHQRWTSMAQSYRDALRSTTVSDLLKGR